MEENEQLPDAIRGRLGRGWVGFIGWSIPGGLVAWGGLIQVGLASPAPPGASGAAMNWLLWGVWPIGLGGLGFMLRRAMRERAIRFAREWQLAALAQDWPLDRRLGAIEAHPWEGSSLFAAVHPNDHRIQAYIQVTNWGPYRAVITVTGISVRTHDGDLIQGTYAAPIRLALERHGGTESFNATFNLLPSSVASVAKHPSDLPAEIMLHGTHSDHDGQSLLSLELRAPISVITAKLDYQTGAAIDWKRDKG